MKRAIIMNIVALVSMQGCASSPQAPEALRPPAGQELVLALQADGVQIYDCAAAAQGGYEWKFRAPDATLRDVVGRPMGSHYAGPTWRAPDGSTVVGEVRSRAPAKDPANIPLLLLAAKAHGDGDGTFSKVASIQRLDTVGGQAPANSCSSATDLARVARVPYSAVYYFYQ
jgi:hypothetical protein